MVLTFWEMMEGGERILVVFCRVRFRSYFHTDLEESFYHFFFVQVSMFLFLRFHLNLSFDRNSK